jgi:hypothetical protein
MHTQRREWIFRLRYSEYQRVMPIVGFYIPFFSLYCTTLHCWDHAIVNRVLVSIVALSILSSSDVAEVALGSLPYRRLKFQFRLCVFFFFLAYRYECDCNKRRSVLGLPPLASNSKQKAQAQTGQQFRTITGSPPKAPLNVTQSSKTITPRLGEWESCEEGPASHQTTLHSHPIT